MKYIEVGSKAHKHVSLGVLIGSTITFAIMYSPQPLISLFSKQYHIAPETASLSISLTTIALAISLFFVSMFSSSWNRKKFLCGSLLITSCLSILTSFIGNFYLFLSLRFFEGVSIAGYPAIAMAYLNEEFSPKDIGTVIGYYVAGNSLGALIGRIIIGTLTDITNWHTAFMIQGIVSLIGSIWLYISLPESQNFVKKSFSKYQLVSNIKSTLFNKKLLSMYATGLLLMGSYVTILDYIGFPLTRAPYSLSQTVFGFIFLVNLFGIWSSILFGKLADQYSRKHVIGLAIAIFIAGVLLTLNEHLIIKIIGLSGVAFGFTAANSVASSWTGLLASKDTKGQASSFYLLFYYVGSSLFGWLGGIFLNHFGWNGIVCYVCFLLFAAGLVSCKPWNTLYRRILLLTN
jgi:YNFM family putative membrane transporter